LVIGGDELKIDDFYNVHKYSQQKVKLCEGVDNDCSCQYHFRGISSYFKKEIK